MGRFPDVPESHWAYEAVERLAAEGKIGGYPDGLFHGERTPNRYEIAAILDRFSHPLPSPPTSLLETVISDMFGPPFRQGTAADGWWGPPWGAGEVPLDVPAGVDWRTGARGGRWDNPGPRTHLTAWGHGAVLVGGIGPSRDWRIHIRRHRVYVRRQNTWTKLIEAEPAVWDGGWYVQPGQWAGRGDWRREGEGWSVACPQDATWKFLHWWPAMRVALPPQPFILLAFAELRLIPNANPSVDLQGVRFAAGVGADYHYNPPSFSVIPDAADTTTKFKTNLTDPAGMWSNGFNARITSGPNAGQTRTIVEYAAGGWIRVSAPFPSAEWGASDKGAIGEVPPIPGTGVARHKPITPSWQPFTQITFPSPQPPKNDPTYDYRAPFQGLALPQEIGE